MREMRKIPVFESAVAPLDICLAKWIDFHRRNDLDIGWHGSSSMLVSDAEADSQQLYDRSDSMVGKAVDAEVNGLSTHLCEAMKRTCGMMTVWRWSSLVFENVVVDAKRELENKLKKNVATRSIFP